MQSGGIQGIDDDECEKQQVVIDSETLLEGNRKFKTVFEFLNF